MAQKEGKKFTVYVTAIATFEKQRRVSVEASCQLQLSPGAL